MNKYSSRLFAMPNFIGGIARVLDLGSTLNTYNVFSSEQEADYTALSRDWEIVGSDIVEAAQSTEANEIKGN